MSRYENDRTLGSGGVNAFAMGCLQNMPSCDADLAAQVTKMLQSEDGSEYSVSSAHSTPLGRGRTKSGPPPLTQRSLNLSQPDTPGLTKHVNIRMAGLQNQMTTQIIGMAKAHYVRLNNARAEALLRQNAEETAVLRQEMDEKVEMVRREMAEANKRGENAAATTTAAMVEEHSSEIAEVQREVTKLRSDLAKSQQETRDNRAAGIELLGQLGVVASRVSTWESGDNNKLMSFIESNGGPEHYCKTGKQRIKTKTVKPDFLEYVRTHIPGKMFISEKAAGDKMYQIVGKMLADSEDDC